MTADCFELVTVIKKANVYSGVSARFPLNVHVHALVLDAVCAADAGGVLAGPGHWER